MKRGHSSWSGTELEVKLGDWPWRTGERVEDLHSDCLLHWLEGLVGSQGVPAGFGV